MAFWAEESRWSQFNYIGSLILKVKELKNVTYGCYVLWSKNHSCVPSCVTLCCGCHGSLAKWTNSVLQKNALIFDHQCKELVHGHTFTHTHIHNVCRLRYFLCQNWHIWKLFSTNYRTFFDVPIKPKFAETALLFCRVTDVAFLPKMDKIGIRDSLKGWDCCTKYGLVCEWDIKLGIIPLWSAEEELSNDVLKNDF